MHIFFISSNRQAPIHLSISFPKYLLNAYFRPDIMHRDSTYSVELIAMVYFLKNFKILWGSYILN